MQKADEWARKWSSLFSMLSVIVYRVGVEGSWRIQALARRTPGLFVQRDFDAGGVGYRDRPGEENYY